MSLGYKTVRIRRQVRPQDDPHTYTEASSPKYLWNLLLNDPLTNFSIMALHMIPYLNLEETVPEVPCTILRKLMEVPGLANAADSIELEHFGMVRIKVHEVVKIVELECQRQLDLVGMDDTVADWSSPKLSYTATA
jgi:hypothetical protein